MKIKNAARILVVSVIVLTAAFFFKPLSCHAAAISADSNELWINHAASSFAGGKGTEKNPYQISSAKELALLSKLLTGDKAPKYCAAYYELTSDIDLGKYKWYPIGGAGCTDVTGEDITISFYEPGKCFTGCFNGNNHTITNLTISPIKKVFSYGLFGVLFQWSSIRDLNIEGVSITGKYSSLYQSIGALAGNNADDNMITIKSCHVNSFILDIRANKGNCAGLLGVCGNASIIDSSVKGTIKYTGLEGDVSGFTYGANICEIRNCSYEGTINCSIQQSASVGGFINWYSSNTVMENCLCAADITVEDSRDKPWAIAGFSAENVYFDDSYRKNCVFAGSLKLNGGELTGEKDIFSDMPFGEYVYEEDGSQAFAYYSNLIQVTDELIYVYDYPKSDGWAPANKVYADISDYEMLFKNELGFTEDNWSFSKTELPRPKPYTEPICEHDYFRKSDGKEKLYVCKTCGKLKANIRESIKNDETTASIKKQTYTGKAVEPAVAVKFYKIKLIRNKDYSVSYENNVNVGKATAIIKGTGHFKGSFKKTFTIVKAANPLKIESRKFSIKQPKRATTIRIKVLKSRGKVTYTPGKAAKAANIKVSGKGKITIPKYCIKGIYKISVKAAGNKNYKAGKKTVTVTVK